MGETSELWSLVERYCDGQLPAQELSRFEELLTFDVAARRFYAAYLQAHSQLAWECRGVVASPANLTASSGSNSGQIKSPTVKSKMTGLGLLGGITSRLSINRTSAALWTLALIVNCALIFVLALAVSPQLRLSVGWQEPIAQTEREEKTTLVYPARLIATRDCRWADSSKPPHVGDLLSSEIVCLKSGFAEFEFLSGARVTLEGPAEFDLQSTSQGFLRLGKLVAKVPPQAKGFAIETVSARVVDLGTEFGVKVEPSGATEVYVFQGVVETVVTDRQDRSPRAYRLTGNQAVRIDGAELQNLPADAPQTRFVRHLPRLTRDAGPIIQYDFESLTPEAVPDVIAGPVDHTMGNVSRVDTRIRQTDDSRQGKHAARFDGPSVQATAYCPITKRDDPLRTGAMTIAFWMKLDGSNADYMMPLVWDDGSDEKADPMGENAPWTVQINQGIGTSRTLRFIPDQFGSIDAAVPADEWVHVAIVHRGNMTWIYLNGNSTPIISRITAELKATTNGKLRLGSRRNAYFFQGLLDDVRIYNRPLSPEEIPSLCQASETRE